MDIPIEKESVMRYTGTLFKIYRKTTWWWSLDSYEDLMCYCGCCIIDYVPGRVAGRRVIVDVTPDGVEVVDNSHARNVFKKLPRHTLKEMLIKRFQDNYNYLIVAFEDRGWLRQKLTCFIIRMDEPPAPSSSVSNILDPDSDDLSQLSLTSPISRRETLRIEEDFLSPSPDNSRLIKRIVRREETTETISPDGTLYQTAMAFPNDSRCMETSLQHQNSWASGRSFERPYENITPRRPSCKRILPLRGTRLGRLSESPESPCDLNKTFIQCSSAPLNRNTQVPSTPLNSTQIPVSDGISTPGRLKQAGDNPTSRHGTRPETLDSFQLNDSQWTPDSRIKC